MFDILGRVAPTGISEHIEYYVEALDKWLNIKIFSPKKGYFFSVIDDITKRKQIEEELIKANNRAKRNEENLNKVQLITHTGSWYLNLATNEVTWTEELYRMYGFDPALPVPPYSEHQKLFTPESWESLSVALKQTSETGIPYELELKTVRENGSNGWMWVRGETVMDQDNKIIGLWGAAQDITERKLATEELLKAKQKVAKSKKLKAAKLILEKTEKELNEAQKLAHLGSWSFDLATQKIKWSDESFHIWGLDPNKDTPPKFEALVAQIHKDDQELFTTSLEKAVNQGKPCDIEHRICFPNGEQKVVRTICQPVIGAQGKVLSLAGTGQDITQQKMLDIELIKAKEKAEESEDYLNKIINNIGDPVFVKDDKYRFVLVNDSFCKLLGIPKNKIIGKTLAEDFPADQMEGFLKIDQQVLSSGEENLNEELAARSNGDELTIITKKSRYIDEHDNKFIIGTIRDITEQKKNKEEKLAAKLLLEKTEKELNEAQALAKVGSWIFDLSSQKIEWSDEMFHIWGFDVKKGAPEYDELVKRVHPNDLELWNSSVEKAINPGIPYNIEHRISLPNGEQKMVRGICQPVLGATGEVVGLTGTGQDITEQKRLDTELLKAKEKAEESDRLKSAFLANMSHELRTPMNGILGFSELLKEKNISDEKKDMYLGLIEKEGNRLLSFISNIVDISKIESNVITVNKSFCNINTLIDELYSKYSIILTGKSIKLQTKKGLGDTASCVQTDTNKLVQVISNLLENAIKFTKEGEIEFGYSLSTNDLKFYIKDSGVGIEIEEQKHIFNRFTQGKLEQTHNHGVGLGLSIVQGLVHILGGEVGVDSQTGVGSTFFFTIPYEKALTELKVVSDHSDTALENGHFTILIAEDDEFSFMYLKACLSGFNCSILHAINGKVAVELVTQNAAIDVVLMDINMPEMNGDQALKEIRKTNKELPIIAQTGLAMSGDRERLLEAGFNDYIAKPISSKVLITTINKYLKKVTGANNVKKT